MAIESPDLIWAKNYDTNLLPKGQKIKEPSIAAKLLRKIIANKTMNGTTTNRLASGTVAADIGCGDGRNSIYLAREGFEIHAIDHDGSTKPEIETYGITVHSHDPTDSLFFEDRFFDAILDSGCYHEGLENEKKERYIVELCRTLKPHGTFALILTGQVHGITDSLILETFSVLAEKKDGNDLAVVLRKRQI